MTRALQSTHVRIQGWSSERVRIQGWSSERDGRTDGVQTNKRKFLCLILDKGMFKLGGPIFGILCSGSRKKDMVSDIFSQFPLI